MSSCVKSKERYLLVSSDGAGFEEYGIKAKGENCSEAVIGNVTDDRRFAVSLVRFLNKNEVAPEHLLQVIEEILCGWIGLED